LWCSQKRKEILVQRKEKKRYIFFVTITHRSLRAPARPKGGLRVNEAMVEAMVTNDFLSFPRNFLSFARERARNVVAGERPQQKKEKRNPASRIRTGDIAVSTTPFSFSWSFERHFLSFRVANTAGKERKGVSYYSRAL